MTESLAPSVPITDEPIPLRKPVVLGPGEGRAYPMGRISATFKADGTETASRYSNLSIPGEFEPHMPDIAQWFLENPPGNAGI